MYNQYKGRIVKIEKYQSRATYIKHGVKEPDQYKYANYPGDCGTYVTGGEYYGTILNVKIFLYDFEQCITYDVYEDVLRLTGQKKISAQLLSTIESHEGDKVMVLSSDGRTFYFDAQQLLN